MTTHAQGSNRFSEAELASLRAAVERLGLTRASRQLTIATKTLGRIVIGRPVTAETGARVRSFLRDLDAAGTCPQRSHISELLTVLLPYVSVSRFCQYLDVDRRTLRALHAGHTAHTDEVLGRVHSLLQTIAAEPRSTLTPFLRRSHAITARVRHGLLPPLPGLSAEDTVAYLEFG
jgi:hypothetical protein